MPSGAIKILVVDDDPAMRMVLDARLRNWGYIVDAAPDGTEAQRCAENKEPDLVISDVIMPGLSGLELLVALKRGNPKRPVILMTAAGTGLIVVAVLSWRTYSYSQSRL